MATHYVYLKIGETDPNLRVGFATQDELTPDKVDWDVFEGPQTIEIADDYDLGSIEVDGNGDIVTLTTAEVAARDAAGGE